MNRERLLELRKQQFIWLNGLVIVYFTIMMMIMHSGITIRGFWIVIVLLSLAQWIKFVKNNKPVNAYLSKNMYELHEYEKGQMSLEWEKQRKTTICGQSFVILIAIFNAWIARPGEDFLIFNPFPFIYIVFIILIVFLNVITYVQARKIDKGEIKEGYTKRMILVNMVVGLVLFMVINFAIFSII